MPKIISPIDESEIGEFSYDSFDSLLRVQSNFSKIEKCTLLSKKRVLEKLVLLLEKNKETLATLITKEMGKRIVEARAEVDRTINTALCARDFAGHLKGEILYADSYMDVSKKAYVEHFPIGVVLAIIPFNFPINLCMHKLAPSYLAGNSTLVKPNPQNYLSTKFFIDLCYEAGFERSQLAMSCPDIPDLQKLIQSDWIDLVSFTGGTQTANKISQIVGRKKVLYELGGNDALVINKDADIEKAAEAIWQNRVGTSGQRCTASKRIFIHEDLFFKIEELILKRVKESKTSNPMDEKSILGPLVHKKAAKDAYDLCLKNRELSSVEFRVLQEPKNAYFEVAMATCSSLEDDAFVDEIFAPVIALFKFNDEQIDSLIKKINSTGYGLQSGVFTNDLRFINNLHAKLKVGCVNVNEGSGFRAENFPFGGVGKSGQGREGIKYAYEEMSVLKSLVI